MEKNQTINCIFEILILNSGAWKYNNFTKFSVMFMQWNFLINFSSSRTEAHTQGFKHLINTIRLNFINGGQKGGKVQLQTTFLFWALKNLLFERKSSSICSI